MSDYEWTPEEDDTILEALLPCQREAQIRAVCDRLAAALGRGERERSHGVVNGELVRRRAWGLITRYKGTKYERCARVRVARGHAPATLFEAELITVALESRSKGAVHGANEILYFAGVLNRPEEWVDETVKELDPRRRFKGFFDT